MEHLKNNIRERKSSNIVIPNRCTSRSYQFWLKKIPSRSHLYIFRKYIESPYQNNIITLHFAINSKKISKNILELYLPVNHNRSISIIIAKNYQSNISPTFQIKIVHVSLLQFLKKKKRKKRRTINETPMVLSDMYHIEASIYDSICRLIAFFLSQFPLPNAQVSRAGEQKRHPQTDVPEVRASLFWIAAAVWLVALLKFSRRDTGSSRWWREGMENVGGWKHEGGKLKHFPAVRREPDGDVQRLLFYLFTSLSLSLLVPGWGGWKEGGRGGGGGGTTHVPPRLRGGCFCSLINESRNPSKSRFTRELTRSPRKTRPRVFIN